MPEVVGGKLKFKNVPKSKKKISDPKEKKVDTAPPPEAAADHHGSTKTAAEQRFAEAQARREAELLKKKASLTHKERVDEFNKKLSELSEHYDVPKVSWTK